MRKSYEPLYNNFGNFGGGMSSLTETSENLKKFFRVISVASNLIISS